MRITFLGTNGWYDSTTGNTPSALIDTKDYYIVLDAGFGIYKLSDHLNENKPVFLFISHFHIDHICGLHTLTKLNPSLASDELKELTILGPKKLKKTLETFTGLPYSLPLNELGFKIKYLELKPGKHQLPFDVTCLPLEHVVPTLGYRFTLEGKTIVYCSDTAVCPNDLELSKDADLLIHECAFLPGHTSSWGHTNPEGAAGLARDAGVKKLFLTHLGADGYFTLEKRKEAESLAKTIFPETTVASDDLQIEVR